MSPFLFDLYLKVWIMKSVSNSMFTTPKRQLDFSLFRVWLHASQIFSKIKVNSVITQPELAATEVVQTLKWARLRLPVPDGKT